MRPLLSHPLEYLATGTPITLLTLPLSVIHRVFWPSLVFHSVPLLGLEHAVMLVLAIGNMLQAYKYLGADCPIEF